MLPLLIRRLIIIIGLLSVMVVLEVVTEESMLLSIPNDIDIIQAIVSKREHQEYIEEEQSKAYEDFYLALEEQEQARLDALENAYTLGDRDKPKDYQNLFDHRIKHTFVIDFDTSEWEGLIDDMESYNQLYGSYRSNNYRKVQVTYSTDDETFIIPDVGIRSKGNIFSRYPPEDGDGNIRPIHYVLKFNETFDTTPGTEEYELLKKREVFDLEKLAFKWNRNGDKTYSSEVYSMQAFRDAGVPAPMMTLTKFVIRIDGNIVMEELYSVQEVIDEEFIRKHLQDVPQEQVGNLYKVVWPGTLEPINDLSLVGIREWETNTRPVYGLETNDDLPNYDDLIDFTYQLSNTDIYERKTFIDNNIAVDNLIRAFAMSVFLGNPDDYRGNANNYYAYFDLNGVFHYIPYDFDHSLGQGWNGWPVFIDYSLGNDIYIWEGDGFGAATDDIPLIDNILLTYTSYQILYEDYLEQFIVDDMFSFASFSELFDTLEGLYGDEFYMVNDKEYYFRTKVDAVLQDIEYYRNQRIN